MFSRALPALVVIPLGLLGVSALGIVPQVLAAPDDAKLMGAAVSYVLIAALLAALIPWGGRRPALAMGVLAGSGVTVFATAQLFGQPAQVMLYVSSVSMSALAVWAAVAKIDQLQHEARSHFD